MNRIGTIGFIAVAAGLALLVLIAHREKASLVERNRALREEVDQLTRAEAARRPLSPLVLHARPGSALPVEQWRELLRLRGELGVLRQVRAEASRLQADNARMRSNWVEQLGGGKKLALAQVSPYLKAKERNAESLVAASQLTGDLRLLREAREKFPNDPRVAFTAYYDFKGDATPEERRALLETFKQSAPENSLANFVSAREYFKAGQMAEAVAELTAAAGKPGFQDYYAELVTSAEEAYQACGLSSLEAAVVASGQPIPQLAELRGLSENLVDLSKRYRQAGDDGSAQAAVQVGVALARQVAEPSPRGTVIAQLVGLKMEQEILVSLDPSSPYDTSGHSVRERLDEIASERKAYQALMKQAGDPLRDLSASELASYYDRLRSSGEPEAIRWLASQKQH